MREALRNLRKWGFHEAEAIHEALWTDPKDWPSRWAVKYSYDQKDHASEIAERHIELNQRTRQGEHKMIPAGSDQWRTMEARKERGESTAPVLLGFEGLGRGIHFDGVDTVYILGLPQKPSAYLHYAGRVGRLGQRAGKVVSIIPRAGEKVLQSWASKIGPGVKFEEEEIERLRSAEVSKDRSYALPLRTKRSMQKPEEEPSKDPFLLPEPEDPFELPRMDDDDELEPEPEPVQIPEKMREAMRNRGTQGDLEVKKIAKELQRATSRWPGPEKVPRHIPRREIWKQERVAKREAKANAKSK